ncbi:signal peptide peptidase SppA [Cellvibrio japonicus]|uniref:Signal peptide peptidase SppA, 67K type n=1 Tax=Cellvibrio japonicus (strain Ueda107) TaxID=498211 RepID=B3PJS6_CELJU|nr:signal peptide peptidase SppA [Cellvibrio japonicus]ACE86286.1 signal peptide peptidase SppA, 67K type [Cellvibrio japonicus Ueda107]
MSVNHYEPAHAREPQPSGPAPKKRGFIRRLFSFIGASITWLRNTLLNLFFILIVIAIIAALGAGAPKPLPTEFALRLAPTGILVDQRTYIDPTSMLLSDENLQEQETLVRDLIEAIQQAATDKRVSMIVIEPGKLLGGGISKINEIGQALEAFKASGKKIIAASHYYSQDQYYLASFADDIYLHDMGSVEVTGYGRYMAYYKTALDKLGITIHAFRSGKYKDFLEPFLRDNMSDESREHNSAWLNALWHSYTQQVEKARNLEPGSLNDFINNMDTYLKQTRGDSAKLALEKGLVDKLLSRQDMEQLLADTVGKKNSKGLYKNVSVKRYLADVRSQVSPEPNLVGLITAVGGIQDGSQRPGSIGSESMLKLLRQAKENDNLKALVIRVDSGGGSAFASEIIRTEINALRDKGIPVFISMGSVAASGGYWIATASDEIWAQPTTITGSIGVFGAFPTLEKTLGNMGITSDGIATTELAGSMSISRPLSPKMGDIVQQSVDNIYQRFIHLVAETRQQTPEQIDAVAQGHVWTGARAKELGLVDNLGTLEDTIAAVAERAGLETYRVELVEPPLSPREELLRSLAENSAWGFIPHSLLESLASLQLLNSVSPIIKPLQELQQLNDPQGVYVKCLECVAP